MSQIPRGYLWPETFDASTNAKHAIWVVEAKNRIEKNPWFFCNAYARKEDAHRRRARQEKITGDTYDFRVVAYVRDEVAP